MASKKDFKVKRSSSGLGLFTNKPLKRNDKVIEYIGEKIDNKEADRRGGKYLFTIKRNLILDGKGRDNLARYINHSCKPNCYAEVDDDAERVYIYARRAIQPGEELTYNYGKTYWEDFIGPKKCRCIKCSPAK